MNCKFCNAELEEGVTLCPSCGEVIAEPKKEKKEKKAKKEKPVKEKLGG